VSVEAESQVLSVAGREVRVTHPDKPYFWKQLKLSKLDVVRYYLAVAEGALAGIRDRPIVLKRFVNGAEAAPFYQKRAPESRPTWLRTATLSFPSGRTAEEIVVDDAPGLAWVVNLGCVELHPHPVRSTDLEHPDELRIDLDPGPGVEFADVRRVALEVKALLEDHKWPPHFRKMKGEAARVAPSRAKETVKAVRTKMPLIVVANSADKESALAGLSRWKSKHPQAAQHLTAQDMLVDSMRGRSSTWTRVRVNLRHVPEALRPTQETPDPDDEEVLSRKPPKRTAPKP